MSSGLLAGKKLLITGVITKDSIAFHAAQVAQQQGAEVLLTSFGRVRRMTERAAARLPVPCDVLELDVNNPDDLTALEAELRQRWGRVDGVLHAIAFAPEDALGGNFLTAPAASAKAAFETSAFSLKALAVAVAPLMEPGASIVGLDFDATKAWPVYDWMGVAKAALESVSRYLARDLGPRGIRVNLISAGPLGTVAARGIPGFEALASLWPQQAPLGWDIDDPGLVAGPIAFLFSDLSRGISGEILHVDGGFTPSAPPASSARLLVACGAVVIAFSAILVKQSHASDSTAAVWRCLYAAVILVPLAVAEDRRVGPRLRSDRVAGLVAGIFFGTDLVLWDRAITDVGAGLATVLANVQVVIVPLVAWLVLREAPGRRVLLALGPVLIGVLLISGVLEHGAYGRDPAAGGACGVGSGAAYVGALLLLRHAGADRRRRVAPLAELTVGAAVAAAVIGVIVGDVNFVPVWPGALWLALVAVTSQVIGWLAISRGLPQLPAATSSLLLMIQPVGSLLLGAVIFSERPSTLQLAGVALLLGAVLFATRRARPRTEPPPG